MERLAERRRMDSAEEQEIAPGVRMRQLIATTSYWLEGPGRGEARRPTSCWEGAISRRGTIRGRSRANVDWAKKVA